MGLWIVDCLRLLRDQAHDGRGQWSLQSPGTNGLLSLSLSLSLSRLNMIQHQLSPARSLLAQAKRPRGSETVVLSTDDGS